MLHCIGHTNVSTPLCPEHIAAKESELQLPGQELQSKYNENEQRTWKLCEIRHTCTHGAPVLCRREAAGAFKIDSDHTCFSTAV